jgi:uncharacterized membrane protein
MSVTPKSVVSGKISVTAVRLLWVFTGILVLIGIAIVVRRSVVILAPPVGHARFPEAAALESGFAGHPLLAMIHIVPALIYLVLSPLQFVPSLRAAKPRLHRVTGRVALIAGLTAGIAALIMSPQMAVGGLNETVATMLFGSLFLIALVKAFLAIRRGRSASHREWMIRAFAIASAVATIRPIMGVFFATSRLTHLTPHDFFGIAFWLGFTLQMIGAEIWINYTRTKPRMRHAYQVNESIAPGKIPFI